MKRQIMGKMMKIIQLKGLGNDILQKKYLYFRMGFISNLYVH